MRTAFGKFVPGKNLPIREFEVQLEVKARNGPDAWKSNLLSIQKLLDHLGRFTRSDSSREKYLRHTYQFSSWCGLSPEELVRLSKLRAEFMLQGFADELANNDCSRAYVNTVIKRLRTFFKTNGFVHDKELNIYTYHVPARYRKVPEYIPTKIEVHSMADAAGSIRDRAVILSLWTSGLRVSTLCALNYGDIATELKNDEPYIMIPVFPKMKNRVRDACKSLVSYYTFITPMAGKALRAYLREREEKYGKIFPDNPLFHSDWSLWARTKRSGKRLGRRGIGIIAKKTARLAGLAQWKYVTPHCLRKAFKSVLRSTTINGGRLDSGCQEFLMGHVLPGTQDVYYDRTKIDFHREEYSKLDFSRSGISMRGIDKLIHMKELEHHLSVGWMFVAKITEDKVIVRRNV